MERDERIKELESKKAAAYKKECWALVIFISVFTTDFIGNMKEGNALLAYFYLTAVIFLSCLFYGIYKAYTPESLENGAQHLKGLNNEEFEAYFVHSQRLLKHGNFLLIYSISLETTEEEYFKYSGNAICIEKYV